MSDWRKIDETCTEVCPECGNELEAKLDGSSTCPNCGAKNVLPCRECQNRNEYDQDFNPDGSKGWTCDWNKKTGCSSFPIKMEV